MYLALEDLPERQYWNYWSARFQEMNSLQLRWQRQLHCDEGTLPMATAAENWLSKSSRWRATAATCALTPERTRE